MVPPEALTFGAVLLCLLVWLALRSARGKGKIGEGKVHGWLRLRLDRKVYRVVSDVTLSAGGRTTQIDHLVISRYGIFVVETKNMTDWIFGSPRNAQWTQVIYRHKARFRNPIRQNEGHVRAVSAMLNLEPDRIFGVVAFVGRSTFCTDMPPEVVEGVSGLTRFITSKRTPVFADYELPRFAERIERFRLAPGRRTDRTHILNVGRARTRRRADTGKCPLCGGAMVERTNRQSGERFLGCARYPDCRGTRPLA